MKQTDPLSGLYVASVTPLSEDGAAIDLGAIGPLLDHFGRRGLKGLLALGSTGEFASLSLEERRAVLSEIFSAKAGMKVIVGCGGTALPEVLDLLALAAKKGAVAALVPPPFYYRTASAEGLERFFRAVLEAAEIPVILYHVPALTGIPIERKMLERLTRFPALWGIKDTGGKMQETVRYLSHPPARVLLGSDTLLETGLKAGIQGSISACANIVPDIVSSIMKSYNQGDDMSAVQKKLTAIRESLRSYPFHASLKYWLHLNGIRSGGIRAPLIPLNAQEADNIAKIRLNSLSH
jgi:dihydrodipicolinate synthase/N-acetylneuraminate lyase